VARLLGFEWGTVAQAAESQPQNTVQLPRREDAAPARELESERVGVVENLIPFRMERTTYSASRPIPPPLPIQRVTAIPLTLAPLFHPGWERCLLSESIHTERDEGGIHIERATEAIARLQPLVRPPRERVRTTSRGCQLLIDIGIGMRPYARDTEVMIKSMKRVAGKQRVHVLRFVDSPINGVIDENGRDVPYTPPDTASVVLALTDAYCGGPLSALRSGVAKDWLATAAIAHDANSKLVILNPYKPERWIPALRRKLVMVYWDRRTQVGDLRRLRKVR